MPGLSSIGSVSGLPFKEFGFFYIAPADTFRGMIADKDTVLAGGAYVTLSGKLFEGSYGGNTTQINIKALQDCRLSVYRLDPGPNDQATLVAQKEAQAGELVYTSTITIRTFFLVEAQ